MLYLRFLVLAVLLIGARQAAAQGRDTAFAVHKLFLQKRQHGEAAAAGGVSMATEAETLWGVVQGRLAGAAPMVLGLHKAARYSASREQEILAGYANGIPLPADVRRQLRRNHFHRTAKDVAAQVP